MKTTILFVALISVGLFCQNKIQQVNLGFDFYPNENFISTSSASTLDFIKIKKPELVTENITKQSSSLIIQFIKSSILPIGLIVFTMWIFFGLDIFRSVKKRKIKIIKT